MEVEESSFQFSLFVRVECQMRIKLLKKMYRQTNEAIKRGDVFQQRPCPFFHEMHRIFAGNEENDQSGLNSQSLNNDEENLPEDELDESEEQHEDEKISVEPTDEKFSQAIDRFIQYQKQSEARWYKYVEQQANLELQRRQEDRAYQFQLIQLLSNVIQTTCSNASSTFVQQMPASPSSSIENLPSVKVNRGEKRAAAASSPAENKRSKLPSNFYSLLAQIHNINDLQETD